MLRKNPILYFAPNLGVKSAQTLFTPRNTDKHRGFQAKGEE